jgi:hypothetical protein
VFNHPIIRDFHLNTEKITHHIFLHILNALKASEISPGQFKLDPKFELVFGVLLNKACYIMKIKCLIGCSIPFKGFGLVPRFRCCKLFVDSGVYSLGTFQQL